MTAPPVGASPPLIDSDLAGNLDERCLYRRSLNTWQSTRLPEGLLTHRGIQRSSYKKSLRARVSS